MRVSSANICAFAEVRFGLLTVVSAGITRVTIGHPSQLYVAGFFHEEDGSPSQVHEIVVRIVNEDLREINKGTGALSFVRPPEINPGEPVLVPFALPLPLPSLPVGGPEFVADKRYDVKLTIDDDTEVLWFYVVDPSAGISLG